jgi:3-oxoacyl-[acyl-carrier protein] reductase
VKPQALVTGASGALGAAIAEALAADGYHLWVHHHRAPGRAAEVVERICARGGSAAVIQADLRSPDDTSLLFARVNGHVKATGAPLAVLVNNAGIAWQGPLRWIDEGALTSMWEINVRAAFWCLQAASIAMARTGGGVIVNVGSRSRTAPLRGQVGYCMTKAALHGLTIAAAQELAGQGIAVHLLEPGGVGAGLDRARPEAALRPADVAEAVRLLCASAGLVAGPLVLPLSAPADIDGVRASIAHARGMGASPAPA